MALSRRRWSYSLRTLFVVFLLAIIVAGCIVFITMPARAKNSAEARAKERVRDEIAAVKSGDKNVIRLSNEMADELSAFVSVRGELGDAGDYELEVWYCHDADKFLRDIAGLRNVRSLLLCKTDVSDAGLKCAATMPDIEWVAFSQGRVSDACMESLRSGSNLDVVRFRDEP